MSIGTRTRIAVAAACALTAAVPAAAQAGTVPMRGVVSGSPYGASNGQMAIPVLFSKTTAGAAGLKSPVGVIVVKRTQQVKLPNGGGYTIPVNLRTGDRFKGFGKVTALQQKVFYPRIVFANTVVYFRSKELSVAELSAAVDALRKSLLDVQNQLATLRDGSIKAFQDVYSQLAALKAALAGLKIPAGVDLTSIQSQIDALSKKLNDTIAGLPDFSKFALASQLPDLTQYAKLTDLTGFLKAADVQTMINSAIGGLASQSSVTTAVADLQTQVNTLKTQLTTVCNAVKGATVTIPALSTTLPITVNTGGVC
jgi:hypothetical protein